jgi:nucleoside-diphosphate-sugar epimerase
MTTDAASGKVYNVAGPEPLTLRQLVEESAAAVNVHPRLLKVPLSPTIWATRVYQNVSSHPRIRAEQLHRLAEDKMFDITEAQVDLGYHPRSFQEGVTEEARELWG